VPTQLGNGEGRCPVGRNEEAHHRDRRGKGPGIRGRIRGSNAGKVLCPAGAGGNLQRAVDQGYDRRRQEGIGSAHEPVGAMKKGERPSRRRIRSPSRSVTPAGGKGALGTWWSQGGFPDTEPGVTDLRSGDEIVMQTSCGGVYAHQRLSLDAIWEGAQRKGQGQNRTRENRPSGIAGGLVETW